MPRLVFWFLLIVLVLGLPLNVASATENATWLDDAYPTPYAGPVLQTTGTNAAHWLIIGAFVIVLIIFLGVAFRRPKS